MNGLTARQAWCAFQSNARWSWSRNEACPHVRKRIKPKWGLRAMICNKSGRSTHNRRSRKTNENAIQNHFSFVVHGGGVAAHGAIPYRRSIVPHQLRPDAQCADLAESPVS